MKVAKNAEVEPDLLKQRFVVDASVACKWLIQEPQSTEALELYVQADLIAPDLLVCEYANVLQKKVQSKHLTEGEARLAAQVLTSAKIVFFPTKHLILTAVQAAIELNHSAYDCMYLALALDQKTFFVTADDRFRAKVLSYQSSQYSTSVLSITEALMRCR